ncbi:related to hydrolase related to dienelactone hydrolase [Cephalotrichum gorgonifer]|uniref:Related to hydrolase related to dienelactone hydrolase n=1 Tax=Cephalotrichum gorgonifer TaxID=2041049 RepID=A0AAE8STA6_9PEZI|nr:related to hydrolase related to dienelactone hydrolase [Cephalotrichum gorgonifer]
MTTMPATSGHSAACCNIPPIVTDAYQAKGTYENVGGFNTYATGPADAEKGILVIMDIFGYFPQTLQGSDILSAYGKDKYRVLIPDWFEGSPADITWFPPTDDDKKRKLGAFFQQNSPPRVAALVPDYVKAASAKYPSIKSWAIVGYCWGGKVATIATSTPDTPFVAAASCHPAMVDPADAPKVKVPFCLLASKDEDSKAVKDFEDGLKVSKHVETFGDQIHGWMAARSDLADERVVSEYRRGYETVLKFFGGCGQ